MPVIWETLLLVIIISAVEENDPLSLEISLNIRQLPQGLDFGRVSAQNMHTDPGQSVLINCTCAQPTPAYGLLSNL